MADVKQSKSGSVLPKPTPPKDVSSGSTASSPPAVSSSALPQSAPKSPPPSTPPSSAPSSPQTSPAPPVSPPTPQPAPAATLASESGRTSATANTPQPASPPPSPPNPSPASNQPPRITSSLLQNLQNVNPVPFQPATPANPTVPTTGPTTAASGASTAPSGVSGVPQESAAFGSAANQSSSPSNTASAPTKSAKPDKKAAGGSKAAQAGGLMNMLRSPIVMIGGAILGVLLLAAGGWFVYANFIAPPAVEVARPSGNTGGPAAPSQPAVELTYWGLWEPAEVMQPLIDAYEQQNPNVTITYEQQRSSQYRERLLAAIEDGSGPDIFRYHNTWIPMVDSVLSPAPNDALTPEEVQQNYYPIMARELVRNNRVIGVPLMYEGLALLYNQSMLEAAAAQPPADWDQVRSLAQQLTIRTEARIERAGIALGTADNVDHFSDILGLMMLQNAANPGNPTNINAQHAMEFYTIFSRSDQVWDETMPPSTVAFANEQVAMILAPSWRIFEIQRANPNINIGVTRVPQLGGTTITWGTYWVEGVNDRSANKAAAWDFLSYLAEAEQLREFHSNATAYREFGELFPRVDMASELSDPLIQPYLEDALYAQSWYMASDTHDNGLNDQMIQYYTDAVNATNQRGNAARALQQVSPGIVQVLSRYRIAVPEVATTPAQ